MELTGIKFMILRSLWAICPHLETKYLLPLCFKIGKEISVSLEDYPMHDKVYGWLQNNKPSTEDYTYIHIFKTWDYQDIVDTLIEEFDIQCS